MSHSDSHSYIFITFFLEALIFCLILIETVTCLVSQTLFVVLMDLANGLNTLCRKYLEQDIPSMPFKEL